MSRYSPVLKWLAAVGIAGMSANARVASAEPPPPAETPVDVVVREPPPPRRLVTVEWNPLPLLIMGKASANVVVVPVDHHALVINPFYTSTTTAPIWVTDSQGNQTVAPQQSFKGFGGEIGYRYYIGQGGPRGFFAGPSFIIASMTATAQNGSETSFFDYGLALDVGYELLVADAVAISLGAGAQYVTQSKSIPNQQYPSDVYANTKLLPRALLSIGWAF
jgi:hypothetical protein